MSPKNRRESEPTSSAQKTRKNQATEKPGEIPVFFFAQKREIFRTKRDKSDFVVAIKTEKRNERRNPI
jgi:hypothetical protein